MDATLRKLLPLAAVTLLLPSCAVNDYLVRHRMMDHRFRDGITRPLKRGMERKLREPCAPCRRAVPAPPGLEQG